MLDNLFAVMTMKNEADRYLESVLIHLLQVTNNIFVFDDQSDDDSVNLALRLGIQVAVRPDNTPGFVDHEGGFRQACWNAFEKTMCPPPNSWILAIDADEMLYNYESLPTLLDQTRYDVLGIEFYHMWNNVQYRLDKAWAPTLSSRLFRYFPGGEFLKRKLACGAEPGYVGELIRQNRACWDTGLKMKHLGYIRDVDKVMKYKRYAELDGGEFHARAHIESILDPNPTLLEWPWPL